jgi:type VI secretion system protein ImpL
MLADAGKRSKRINFNEQFPGSAAVVVNNRDVPAAFTKAGWLAMQDNIKRADKFFGGERWVLGDYASAKPDPAKLGEDLRNRYTADYIERWRAFLRNTSVVRYGGLKDAATKLNTLSGSQTPLLALFWVATQNTAVDNPKVTEAFDAVQKVVPPPATVVQYVWPQNNEYMGSLANLQTAINQVADLGGPPDPNRAAPVRAAADSAHNVVKKMGYTFRIDPEAHVDTITLKLLEAPIESVDAITKGMGAGEINAKAKAFCAFYADIAGKFPFNPGASAEASLQSVNAIFRPRDGKLWVFYEEALRPFLVKQGNDYVANPSAALPLNPSFVNFFNQAARFSDAVYPGGSSEPNLRYSLQPQRSDQIKEMTVSIDGQTTRFTGQEGGGQHVWPAPGSGSVRLTAKLAGGSDLEVQNRDGLWAVFHFFADADRWSGAGGNYTLEWVVRQGREARPVNVGGKELTYRFSLSTGGLAPVFQKEFLNSLRCVATAAK